MLHKKQNKTLTYFEKINRVPRESGNEKGISDWIFQWAKSEGLQVTQDEYFNLVIKKPASVGYEAHKPIMLQAHMDMVCEKTPESTHDFAKDPILLKETDGWITSACGTSLGADNGIGIALAMALMSDKSIAHPPLESAFTVEEETTFSGADNLSADLFESKRMINLDHACDSEMVVGSCGGIGMTMKVPMEFEMPPKLSLNTGKICKLKVTGLLGGHSGEDIHRGHGNAIKLLTRVLKLCHMPIIDIRGGTNRLAIPREAEAVILCTDPDELKNHAKRMRSIFTKEYGQIAPNLDVTVEETNSDVSETTVLTDESQDKLIEVLELFPDGIANMNGKFPGMVECSNNMGIVKLENGKLVITTEIRGMYETTVGALKQRIESLAKLTGAELESFSKYIPWEFSGESQLRNTALQIYKESFGSEMKQLALHAGLECGSFVAKKPEMDVISIGPDCMYFHSVNEKVNINSIDKLYGFLVKILERL